MLMSLDFIGIRPITPEADRHIMDCISFDNERIHCQVGQGQWTTEHSRKAEIWNWGNAGSGRVAATDNPKAIATSTDFKLHQRPWKFNLPINQSLVADVGKALYDRRLAELESQ